VQAASAVTAGCDGLPGFRVASTVLVRDVMRSILVAAFALSACVADDTGDLYIPPPPSFSFQAPSASLGVGLRYRVPAEHDAPIASYEIRSSDPAVEVISDGDDVVVRGVRAGASIITVTRAGEDKVIASLVIDTSDVDHAQLFFRSAPIAQSPVASIAAVIGYDSLDIGYRSIANEELAGEAEVAVSGDAVVLAQGPESRLSDLFTSRQHVALQFVRAGTGAIVVGHQTFPVEVIDAPAAIDLVAIVLRDGELVAAPSPVSAGEPVGIDVVARAADGRFVAGVTAEWTVDATRWSNPGAITELVFSKDNPGTATIGAAVAGQTLTTQISAR
jgi:hypothetical protein